METDFLANGNHFVPISQIYLPLEAVFPSLGNILNESFITASGNGFSIKWKRYSSIHIFLETIIAIRRRPIVFKRILFLLGKPFFLGTDSNGSSFSVQ